MGAIQSTFATLSATGLYELLRYADVKGLPTLSEFTRRPSAKTDLGARQQLDAIAVQRAKTEIDLRDAKNDEDAFRAQARLRGLASRSKAQLELLKAGSDDWWAKIFNFKLLEQRVGWSFARRIHFDGVAITFVRQRCGKKVVPDRAIRLGPKRSYATPIEDYPFIEDFNPEWAVGMDPGRRDFFTFNSIATGDGKHPNLSNSKPTRRRRRRKRGKTRQRPKRKHRSGGRGRRSKPAVPETNWQVSGAQWRFDSGQRQRSDRALRRSDAHRVEIDGVQLSLTDIKKNIPTYKTTRPERLMNHCTYLLRFYTHIIGFALKPKTKRARFDAYLHVNAAIDRLCGRITGGRPKDKVVVFWGAAQCYKGFGYGPSPLNRVRRRLERHARVVVVDEHYTSQRCSLCAFHPERIEKLPGEHVQMRPGRDRNDGHKENVHGVRFCPECGTTHHRDVNSARNMRLLGLFMCMYRRRPPAFWHPTAAV